MSSLYELKNEYKILKEMMEDESIDDQIIKDTMEGVEYEIEIKAENYAKIIRELEGDMSVIKNEIDRLKSKKERIEKNIEKLKENLKEAMLETGKTKIKTDLFSIGIQKNGGKAPMIIDEDMVPNDYLLYTPSINKDLIRQQLEKGEKLDFAHLEERGESLRIK
jgi:predicted nuclease with TOPRIM domain